MNLHGFLQQQFLESDQLLQGLPSPISFNLGVWSWNPARETQAFEGVNVKRCHVVAPACLEVLNQIYLVVEYLG